MRTSVRILKSGVPYLSLIEIFGRGGRVGYIMFMYFLYVILYGGNRKPKINVSTLSIHVSGHVR